MDELEGKIAEETIKGAFSFIDDLIKPSLKEVGQLFAERVHLWRFKNQINVSIKAAKFVRKKGLTLQEVPIKTISKFLEYSSWEENDFMQEKWAGLLASTASSKSDKDIYYILVEVLNQLSPLDVRLLDLLYLKGLSDEYNLKKDYLGFSKGDLFNELNIQVKTGDIVVENLNRMNLIDYKLADMGGSRMKAAFSSGIYKTERILLTKLGLTLVENCRVIPIG